MSLLQIAMDQTEGHEVSNVSVMPEVDIAEQLPNADDPTFASEEEDGHHVAINTLQNVTTAHVQGVFVATTPQTLLTAEQLREVGIKTTHIVIHDQTALSDSGLKTPQPPLSPSPASPLSTGSQKYKYNWDESVHDPILPVRCKNTSGELHKEKFGSGGRGRCIRVGSTWYTPSEFEVLCGRASSKDWKRSIRYGGRTLQCLIEEGILQPHATSCTCAACCDDVTVSGPIRLFVPYKRRKREIEAGLNGSSKKLQHQDSCDDHSPTHLKDPVVVALNSTATGVVTTPTISMNTTGVTDTIHVVTSDALIASAGDAPIVVSSQIGQTPKNTVTMDFNEQKQWWQLEEMVNSLINFGQQVKQLVEQVKNQSIASREIALQQLRAQLEKEKSETLHAARLEAQMAIHRAILEERTEKDISSFQSGRVGMQDKLDTSMNDKSDSIKCCANCNREAYSECTGCHRVSYCSPFCQRKDWTTHQQECNTTSVLLIQEVNISNQEKN